MRVFISDSANTRVAQVFVEGGQVHIQGSFPGDLTPEDLGRLGFVHYETDERGEIVTRVREVRPTESLDYVRALQDALPPGYHISQVESARIDEERRQKRRRFEEELARLEADD
jgi:hypothetical protein